MKNIFFCFLIIFFECAFAFQQDPSVVSKLKQLKISALNLGDLNRDSFMIPAPMTQPTFTETTTVHFWMIGCTGCTDKMKKTWKNKNQVWVNLDENEDEIKNAKDFLKREKIGIIPYHDAEGSFRKQIGRKFILPITLKVHKDKVITVLE